MLFNEYSVFAGFYVTEDGKVTKMNRAAPHIASLTKAQTGQSDHSIRKLQDIMGNTIMFVTEPADKDRNKGAIDCT